ncbi:unnamed protein product [Macrosiphum euphorbiae]|uniref:RING-type domain-containing protein n=1 Tax=Macrosiphum euphorbiae TaxID=13131 RepID=A0AAV0W5Y6_9HEMI|nr:unnamed protein product [Macrosiphum euphorbiae]
MALPLLPVDKKMLKIVCQWKAEEYSKDISSTPRTKCRHLVRKQCYLVDSWTNNVLEVSHQHLRMHMGNIHQPEPWVFLKGLITYSSGVLADYNLAIDGIQVREPQRQIWIDHQRNLDLASRLLAEGRYTVSEFLAFEPIISESCYICHYSMPTVIAIPCRHQGLCAPCHQTYIRMPPYRTIPYYRCPLCRGEITTYFIIV